MDQDARGRIAAERDGTVLVLTLAHPPVNALSVALRRNLLAALQAAADDPAVAAIVLRSALPSFSAGADMREFDHPPAAPFLPDLCQAIEAMEKPVIAAISGAALGGGLELALAAHGRVASESATFGLPEVTLGLLPGAGGTQRLPRLIGAEQALSMMLTGRSVRAVEALATGLLDAVVAGDPTGRAKELARDMATAAPLRTRERRDGMRDGRAYLAAVERARRSLAPSRLTAPARIVDCVAAAQLLPFDQGVAYERAAFAELLAAEESAGLRHAFRAERPLLRPPAAFAGQSPAGVTTVTVWGATARGTDLALRALAAGLRVTLADPSREAVVAALNAIAARQEADVAAGRLSPEARDADWARLATLVAPERLGGDAVLLAQADPPPVAAAALRLAFGVDAPPPAVAVALSEGARPLAEITWSEGQPTEPAARAYHLARRLRWRPVVTGKGGPIARRLAAALSGAVAHLAAAGHDPRDIATALAAHGIAAEGPAATVADAEGIALRCLGALANEGARLFTEGAVSHPDDIDAIAILSGIMARFTGGPMYQADRRGLLVLRRDLTLWSREAPALWLPDPLITKCLSAGIGLGDVARVRTG